LRQWSESPCYCTARGLSKPSLFPRVDRETRFVFGSIHLLTEVLRSGLRVYFAREKLALDPNDPESVERYLSKATQAQAYVQTMKANTSRAKKKLVRQGKLPQGTGVGLFGYDWNRKEKKREVNQPEAAIVREIFNRIADGEKLLTIARRLNNREVPTKTTAVKGNRKLWHTLTMRRMIRNSSYIGKTCFNGEILPEVSPAIVSEAMFQSTNAELDKPKVRNGRPKHDYLLRNHIFCAICGKPMVGHCLNKKYRYYQCSSARPHENTEKICQAKYVRANELEATVWEKTRETISNPELILNEIQNQLAKVSGQGNLQTIDADIQGLETSLSGYERRKENLLEAMELGVFSKDEILDRLNKLKRLRQDDETKLNDLRKMKDNMAGLTDAKIKLGELYDGVLENLHDCTPPLKRQLFDALDLKVYASTESVEIRGIIPLELPTIEQTSACLTTDAYSYLIPFEFRV